MTSAIFIFLSKIAFTASITIGGGSFANVLNGLGDALPEGSQIQVGSFDGVEPSKSGADFTSVEQPVAGTPTAVADGNASRDNASERDHVFCRAYETNVSTAPTPVPGTGRDQLDVHKIAIENPIPPKIRPKLKTARLDCLRILRGGPLCLFGKMFLDWMTQLRIALVCGAIG